MQNPGGFVFRSNSAESLSLAFTAQVAIAAVAEDTPAGGRFVSVRSIHGRSAANADNAAAQTAANTMHLFDTSLTSIPFLKNHLIIPYHAGIFKHRQTISQSVKGNQNSINRPLH